MSDQFMEFMKNLKICDIVIYVMIDRRLGSDVEMKMMSLMIV
jgi:hypothetical protein